MIETCSPLKLFLLFKIVYASSSACDGCSCSPSPALITGTPMCSAITCGAPAFGCRITITSAPTACAVYPVSSSDSPFSMLDPIAWISTVCAPIAFAASSNEPLVRVDAS